MTRLLRHGLSLSHRVSRCLLKSISLNISLSVFFEVLMYELLAASTFIVLRQATNHSSWAISIESHYQDQALKSPWN